MVNGWEIKTVHIAGFLKVKLRRAGLRIVYQLIQEMDHMVLVVIGARKDDEVYHITHKRIQGQGVKSCVSEIRQSQGWRWRNSADSGLKPFLTARPGGQGGMHALA